MEGGQNDTFHDYTQTVDHASDLNSISTLKQ